MKAIVIYYSCGGNTKAVAEALSGYLQEKSEVKLQRLEAQDEAASFLGQAARAFLRKRAMISTPEYDLRGYDLICLGTPVWAFAPAPAMNTYLDKCTGLSGKSAILFTTYGSGTGLARCFNYMQKILSKKGANDFRRFSVQQFKVKDKKFVDKVITETLEINAPVA